VAFVLDVLAALRAQGSRTEVMAASFRTVDQVLALHCCDRLTLSPTLLDQLDRSSTPLPGVDLPAPGSSLGPVTGEAEFARLLSKDAMATELLQTGLARFVADANALAASAANALQDLAGTS
jgi:transaldolase